MGESYILHYFRKLVLIAFAFLIVFYYVLPSKFSILLSVLVILVSIGRIRYNLSVIWYGLFLAYMFLISVFREYRYDYFFSSCNVLLILFAMSLIVQNVVDRKSRES